MTDLSTLNRAQLTERYNEAALELALKTVKSFRDHATALRRTEEILARIAQPVKEQARAPKAAAKEKKARGRKPYFVWKPKDSLKPLGRKDSLRTRAIDRMKADCTMDDLMALVRQFDTVKGKTSETVYHRAYELVRIAHYTIGYGVHHDQATGIFRIYHPQDPEARS